MKQCIILILTFFIPISLFAQCGPPGTGIFGPHVFYENFDDTITCMLQGGDNPWEYGNSTTTPIGFATGAADSIPNIPIPYITGGDNFIGMDGSDNTNGQISTLTTPDIDISVFSFPVLEYAYFSNNIVDAAQNQLLVEVYNGNTWTAIDTHQNNHPSWLNQCVQLYSLPFLANASLIKVRFSVIGDNSMGGHTANNDILLDNIFVHETKDCPTPNGLSAGATSPITGSAGAGTNSTSYSLQAISFSIVAVSPNVPSPSIGQSTGITSLYPYPTGGYASTTFSNLAPGATYAVTCASSCHNDCLLGTSSGTGYGGVLSPDIVYFSTPFPACTTTPVLGDSYHHPIVASSPSFMHSAHTDSCFTNTNNTGNNDVWYEVILDPCADSLHIAFQEAQLNHAGFPLSANLRAYIRDKQNNIIASNISNYHEMLNTGTINSGDTIYVVIEAFGNYTGSSMFPNPPTSTITGNNYTININQTIASPNPSFSYPSSNYCNNYSTIAPTISGLGTPNFSTTQLNINATTGVITLDSASTGYHTIYNTVSAPNIPTCTATDSFQLTISNIQSIIHNSTDIDCFGNNNGTASVVANNGLQPYTYLWSNGDTSTAITGLSIGNYIVTITDANGCQTTTSATISQPNALTVQDSTSHVDCFGNATGSIHINPSGGTPSYSFLWNNGDTNATMTGLSIGNYIVTITDANGCQTTTSATISQPNALTVQDSTSHVDCFGNATGSIHINPSGGTPNYSFLWNNGNTNATIAGVSVGNYMVTITDANGCQTTTSATISQPNALTVQDSTSHVDCFGNATGSIHINPSGGTPNYSFLWNNGNTSTTIAGLSVGNYIVTITDANGCQTTTSATISQPNALTVQDSTSHVDCFGNATGSIHINPSGGTPSYSFLWNNGDTNATITGLSIGNYIVTITDANGCQTTTSATVSEPASPLTISITDNGDRSATANPTGGTSGYTFLWDNNANNQTTATAINLINNQSYTVTVTDANGCTDTATVMIQYLNLELLDQVSELNIYPNPAQKYAIVDLVLNKPQDCLIQLINPLGQVIEEQQLKRVSKASTNFDTTKLSNGVYWIKIKINHQSQTLPLVIKK